MDVRLKIGDTEIKGVIESCKIVQLSDGANTVMQLRFPTFSESEAIIHRQGKMTLWRPDTTGFELVVRGTELFEKLSKEFV